MSRAMLRYRETYNGVKIDLTANSQKELMEKVRRRKDEIDNSINTNKSSISVSVWAYEWLNVYKKADLSAPVYKSYKAMIDLYVMPIIGHTRVKMVTPTEVKNVINSDNKGDWHKIKLIQILKAIFESAVDNRIIDINPCKNITAPSIPTSSIHTLADDERNILLTVCKNHPAGLWIETLLFTGMRPQESAALLWSDLNEKTHSVKIDKALNADGKIGKTKTHSSVRSVPIPDFLWNKLILNKEKPNDYIFKTPIAANCKGNQPLNKQSIKRHWQSIQRQMLIEAGANLYRNQITTDNPNDLVERIRKLTLYNLRHTYATDMCRAGVPMRSAVALMGHSDSKMIIKIYSDFTQDQADDARNKLVEFYNRAGTNAGTENNI